MPVLKDQVIRSCRHVLKPLARFLIRHGVSWSEFAEVGKDAYVDAARDEYGIDGRPTNNSRVAMLTGLSRREVARVRDRLIEGEEDPDLRAGNRLSRVLTGWHMDPEFTDVDGQPKELPAEGEGGSLSSLLKRYAGDLPHGAVRKELQQRGLIEELAGDRVRVLKRDYVYSNLDPDIVRQMGVALHDHAATLDHNLNEERAAAARFEGIADNAMTSPKALEAFQELVASKGLSFLEEVDAWLAEHQVDDAGKANPRTVRMGVGVYLIYDDSNQGQ